MEKVNCITFCKDKYKSEQEWKDAIAATVMLLLEAEYIMTVRYDEKGLGIVCIDYDYADRTYGGPYPYWLDSDDFDLYFENKHLQCEDNEG